MENNQLSTFDLIIETHIGLERQGPGSPEMTVKALSFLDNLNKISRVELYSKYKQHYGYVFYIGKKYKNLCNMEIGYKRNKSSE